MKRRLLVLLLPGLWLFGLLPAAERRWAEPVITDDSPASFRITWRNDTGTPARFGPSAEGLRWRYHGTTKLGLELDLAGAHIPAFNDIKVARFATSRPRTQLAQWQLKISDTWTKGQEFSARGGGVGKEPPSDGLLPGFRSVAFTLTPDRLGAGWTASLTWSN